MFKISPAVKISIGLVILTLAVLLIAETLGLIPDRRTEMLESRKQFSESLAIHATVAAETDNTAQIKETFELLKDRHGDLVSAKLIKVDGDVLATIGEHALHWRDHAEDKSTPTHVHVPIFQGNDRWASLQVVFAPLKSHPWWPFSSSNFVALLGMVSLIGFILYWLFMRRVLGALDLQAVIPARVKAAFDSLSEGVLILNDDQQIVLSNEAFDKKIGVENSELTGIDASSLPWVSIGDSRSNQHHPWVRCVREDQAQIATPIRFSLKSGEILTFMVNATPIHGDDKQTRGVLATFDDVTDLERKHQEQQHTLQELKQTRVALQNRARELETLASRDPLTGCHNRRSFTEKLAVAIRESVEKNQPLSCTMLDIDFFKSVNDNYGHGVGDEVIIYLADLLTSKSRRRDFVGRLGGEEFCMVFPGINADEAMSVVEDIRLSVYRGVASTSVPDLKVTASFGVAAYADDIGDFSELLNRADEALYAAKNAGRDRVVKWLSDEEYATSDRSDAVPSKQATLIDGNQAEPNAQTLKKKIVELKHELQQASGTTRTCSDFDELTGLPSRVTFLKNLGVELKKCASLKQHAVVLSLDIDSFRRVNDALGTAVGDQLLTRVAETISIAAHMASASDDAAGSAMKTSVARIANDEFAIFLGGVPSLKTAQNIAKRVLHHLPELLEIEGRDVFLTYSSGISLFPVNSSRAEQLLDFANAARSTSKRNKGRNSGLFYRADMIESSNRDLWLETQLHRALKQNEFSLRYQPIVNLQSGRIESMEALLRWQHPIAGQISPVDFIPIAESTGFIRSIGHWVLEEACGQMAKWQGQGFKRVSISVNLSGIQLAHESLLRDIGSILRRTGLPPSALVLEITESTLLHGSGAAAYVAKTLRKYGIKIALDDFGTGYSSLGALKSLPVDTLKLDREFVGDNVPDREDQLIIESVISIAHGLGLKVTTEGVTSEEQRKLLRLLDCDHMQGFLFSKPLLADDATALLRSNLRSNAKIRARSGANTARKANKKVRSAKPQRKAKVA